MPMMPPEHTLMPTSCAQRMVCTLSAMVCVVQTCEKNDGAVSILQ